MANRPIPPLTTKQIDRFWSRVHILTIGECWQWAGRVIRDRCGASRGRFTVGKHDYLASRITYLLSRNVDPEQLMVCHSCDNTLCCNPDHLWLGTRSQNNADRAQKKRSAPVHGEHNGNHKLTEQQVKEIRKSLESSEALAAVYGVHFSTICYIRSGKLWKHVA